MLLDIVEIGTSDFRTEAGRKNGLFIEPVKEHFNRLPPCRKENIAISNRNGEMTICYIPSDTIKQMNLPRWVRGCNSINNPHPTLVDMGLSKYIVCDRVKVERIASVLQRHAVTDITFLKIDTEGHDTVILNDFLSTCSIKPSKIQFEANVLSDQEEVRKCVNRLTSMGYSCKQVKFDMVCILS